MRFQTPATGKGSTAPGPAGGQGAGPVARETRETIARLTNCIIALATEKVLLFDTTIQYTYDASLKYQVIKFFFFFGPVQKRLLTVLLCVMAEYGKCFNLIFLCYDISL